MPSNFFNNSPTGGTSGQTNVSVSPRDTNTGHVDLTSFITFTAGTFSTQVTLKQKYKPYLTQGPTSFPASGGSIQVYIYTEYDIVFRSVPLWITISSGNTTYTQGQRISVSSLGSMPATFTLTAEANTGTSRTIEYEDMNVAHYIGNTLNTTNPMKIYGTQAANQAITVNPSSLTFDWNEETAENVALTAYTAWNSAFAGNGFYVSPVSGNGSTTLSVATAANNTGTTDITDTLTLSTTSSSTTVSLKQLYRPYFSMTGGNTFPNSGGTLYFTVHTEYDIAFWNIPSWITIKRNQTTYSNGTRISKGVADGSIFALIAAENTGATRDDNYMCMGHYIDDTLQTYYQYFGCEQDAAYKYQPLTFEIESAGTINFLHNRTALGDVGDLTIQYKIGNGNWTNFTSSTGGTSINVGRGNKVQFRGDNAKYGALPLSYNTFSGSTAVFKAYGNVLSLVNSTSYPQLNSLDEQYMFNRLFAGTKMTTAENLVMDVDSVAMHACSSMFEGCTALTKSFEMPAATLTNSCYNEMFKGCSSLNHIRCYATDISAYNCTYNWVSGVSATGTFVKHTSMTGWSTGNDGIPTGWVVQNYTPPKDMAISPTTINATSAQTTATVAVSTTGCSFTGFTYTNDNASWTITAVKDGNNISLTFAANTGSYRDALLTFNLKDEYNNTYVKTLTITQDSASLGNWTIYNNLQYTVFTDWTCSNGSFTSEITASMGETRTGDALPLTIQGLALIPNPSQSQSNRYSVYNPANNNSFILTYDSVNSIWFGTGSITVNSGDTVVIDNA